MIAPFVWNLLKELRVLACNHAFHKECLVPWIKSALLEKGIQNVQFVDKKYIPILLSRKK